MKAVEDALKDEQAAEASAQLSVPSGTQSRITSSAPASSSVVGSSPVAVFRINRDDYANVQDVLDSEYISNRIKSLHIEVGLPLDNLARVRLPLISQCTPEISVTDFKIVV